MKFTSSIICLFAIFTASAVGFDEIRPILEAKCIKCHGGEKVKGKVDFTKFETEADVDAQFELWETVAAVIEDGEMPPEDEPALTENEEKALLAWHKRRMETPVEAVPGHFRPRRLSANEYRNTLRSLFGFDLEVSIQKAEQTVVGEKSLVLKLLPTDPPGESGFVNDTRKTPLSTVMWDQYSFLVDVALDQLFSAKRKAQLAELIGEELSEAWKPSGFKPEQAEALVRGFVSRALRRPADEDKLASILSGLRDKQGEELVSATKFELKAVLMSPGFIYRGVLMDSKAGQQPVDAYELAERLSYFLWEDMPDAELMQAAKDGSILKEDIMAAQVRRMLASPKARNLAESFGSQWLELAEIDKITAKDPIRNYAFTSQPVDFLNYLFTENRPVMELIDSRTTFANDHTAGYYGKDRSKMTKYTKQKGIERQTMPNQRLTLEHSKDRGGIMTIPGVLMMNHGPIHRGTWMLRNILGEHLGEPPADVPPIKPVPRGQKMTFRERFEAHRADQTCALCHEKIDPLGFALDGYDSNGRNILANAKPGQAKVDTSGKLPSGEEFESYTELKQILLTSHREKIVRNAVQKTLSYALCRKLGRFDMPVVDAITKDIC